MIVANKVVGVLEPRIGKRFTMLADGYVPDISVFSEFDKKFLKSVNWSSRVVKVTECSI